MSSKTKQQAKAAERAARLAELQRKQRAQERRRNLMIGGVVLVVLAVIGTGFLLLSKQNDVQATAAGESEYGVTIGRSDAPHELVVYEDFLCPGCGEFEAATHEELATLADEGKVYVDYRPFTLLDRLGDYSARAAGAFGVVLEQAGPEVAKKFHDALYADQPAEDAAAFPDADALVAMAVEAGATEDAVRAGIEEGENDFAKAATAEAEQAGVNATPTLLLDGDVYSGSFDELLDELR